MTTQTFTTDPTPGDAPGRASAAAQTTIAVCDDHAVVREGVVRILASTAGFEVVSSTATARDLLDDLSRRPVDVCILDISLPDCNGVEVIPEILRTYPDTQVLVFTNHPVSSIGLVCVEAGARAFVGKGAAPSELVDALCAIRRGDVHLPSELVNALVNRESSAQPHSRLSTREWEVFIRLANGFRISEVAADLILDQRTVTTYRRRVLDKLGIDGNAGLVAYAIIHDLVDADAVVHHDR